MVFCRGYEYLQELAQEAAAASEAAAVAALATVAQALSSSLIDCYANLPSDTLSAASQHVWSAASRHSSHHPDGSPVMQHLPFNTSSAASWHSSRCPDGPPSIAAASYGGSRSSRCPDPDGVDAPTVFCHPRSLSGGFSSSSFAYEGTHYHDPCLVGVPPPRQVHGGMSVTLAICQGFNPCIHSPTRHPTGGSSIVPLGPDLYGGTQLPSARVPSVVYGGGLPQEPVP